MADERTTPERPSPAAYDDYRDYLRDMIQFLKESGPGFSHRQFARKAGFNTSSFLKLVIDGKRNLTADSIGRFSKALGLDARERDAFEALVMFSQAGTDDERNRYYQQLRRSPHPVTSAAKMKRSQYEVYSAWHNIPVREMFLLPDFREDPEWIAKRLKPPVTRSEAQKALTRLEDLGLVRRNGDGKLELDSPKLSAESPVELLAARNYHREMLTLAASSMDNLPREERNVTSVTIALTREQYELICREIEEFGKNLLNRIEDAPRGDEPREVYVLGMQLFAVTGGKKP
ncbi:MAG: TIGR02147 family protein [Deltaproteobacteria bacterium]|nr:TIGR02147 family protein [Deltaproteobacteria bacterium]